MNLKFLSILLLLVSILHIDAKSQRTCISTTPVVNNGVISESDIAAPVPEVIIIPVVVHIVFHSEHENISNEQVKSQIAVLNNDFRKKNSDAAFIPSSFKDLAADAHIEFKLATLDPHGTPSSGITRTFTEQTAFAADDKVKSDATGGKNGWDRDKYLNIWVCNLNNGVMGYASSPGSEAQTDGVVIRYAAFGTTPNVAAPFNKGRTTVHEVGHWLGLRHIWGDAACGDDKIEDTPPQQGPTRGCPSGVLATCSSGAAGNMYMNFMDFTNDECTNMFTHGQAAKMRELFGNGGSRMALLTSDRANGVNAEEHLAGNENTGRISLSPNPATSRIRIIRPANSPAIAAQIFNQSGQLVRSAVLTGNATEIMVNDLRSGMYYVSLGAGKAMRFVKN